jgi:hypothetical protein
VVEVALGVGLQVFVVADLREHDAVEVCQVGLAARDPVALEEVEQRAAAVVAYAVPGDEQGIDGRRVALDYLYDGSGHRRASLLRRVSDDGHGYVGDRDGPIGRGRAIGRGGRSREIGRSRKISNQRRVRVGEGGGSPRIVGLLGRIGEVRKRGVDVRAGRAVWRCRGISEGLGLGALAAVTTEVRGRQAIRRELDLWILNPYVGLGEQIVGRR